jgi:hypothetical protein
VINKYKTGKHFDVAITDDSLTVIRRQNQIDEEAALDAIYVIRTPVPAAVPRLAEPTDTQRQAFDLIGVPIPLTLK